MFSLRSFSREILRTLKTCVIEEILLNNNMLKLAINALIKMWNQSLFNNEKNIPDVVFGSILLALNEFSRPFQLFLELTLSLYLFIG